ncbi:hypothetical protein E2C01_007487 [Portunus trituberculatus]|uniref:Uncharacterized protein n=1 Tax=Portunus trituberculatus TaxID=210409 RepID=A0A5B7D2J7_PORTR|nr:hypothetical protein [Portunus trituberculatus]
MCECAVLAVSRTAGLQGAQLGGGAGVPTAEREIGGGGAGASSDDALGVAAGEGEAETTGGRKARLLSVKMWPHWSTREVQAALLQAAGMAHSKWISCSVVRLRDARGSLVPLTPTTLRSSPTRPLHMEIMATGRGADLPLLPNAFRETVLTITQRLEARVSVALPCFISLISLISQPDLLNLLSSHVAPLSGCPQSITCLTCTAFFTAITYLSTCLESRDLLAVPSLTQSLISQCVRQFFDAICQRGENGAQLDPAPFLYIMTSLCLHSFLFSRSYHPTHSYTTLLSSLYSQPPLSPPPPSTPSLGLPCIPHSPFPHSSSPTPLSHPFLPLLDKSTRSVTLF